MFLKCGGCGHFVHVPRPICERCGCEELVPTEVAGTGSLYAYTVTVQAFHPYYVDKVPYVAAVVELDEEPGLRITTQIVDCPESELQTGIRVEVVFTEVAPDWVLPYFRPVR